MFEEVINQILKFGDVIVSVLQQLNSWILQNFGGYMLLIATFAALAAWRKASKAHKNQDSMQRLADAIIKQYNKELREGK